MDFGLSHLPLTLALAAVATLGYLVGRRGRARSRELVQRSERELRRAQSVARELEKIAWQVRRNVSRHHASVAKFKDRVGKLTGTQQEAAWKELCQEAEEILAPTLRLANQIAAAYDQLRHQTNNLMSFTEVRTDPLTGVGNRRGLDDSLDTQFALLSRYELRFSVAIFDIDHFKRVNDKQGHLEGDRMLGRLARLLDETARETDYIARYGGEEFVVVMPQTDLPGACTFAERVRAEVERQLPVTISGGVTGVLDGDSADALLARADAALYTAKSSGRNHVCRHTGHRIEAIAEETVEMSG